MIITSSTLTTLYDYHYWANARLLKACEALTPEHWDKPFAHSWGSVHGMLAHMLAAEVIWLARWQGESPKVLRQPEEFPTVADVQTAWAGVETELRNFLEGCDDARLAGTVTYTNTKGKPFSFPLGPLMLHVANHGTHHRGELAAMLTLLQVPHLEDDLLFYFIEEQKSPDHPARKGR